MSINVEQRVQELIRHGYTGEHDTERLSPDGAATIVAAEIIAEAIKEAAAPPQKAEQPHNITLNISPTDRQAVALEINELLKQRKVNQLIDQITEDSQQKSERTPDTHQHSQEPQ